MKRKLFAFDIDGTLLGSDKLPLDSTREALEKLRAQGHLVTIATGRSRFMAQNVIADLGFTNYVLCNGAAAFLDHEQYYQNLLDRDELHRFSALVEQQKIGLAYVGLDDVKKTNHHRLEQMSEAMRTINYEAPVFDLNFHQTNDVYQALAFYDVEDEGRFDAEFPEFRFVEIDRDQFIDLASTWNIFGIPSFVVTKNGKELGRLVNKNRKTKEEISLFLRGLAD